MKFNGLEREIYIWGMCLERDRERKKEKDTGLEVQRERLEVQREKYIVSYASRERNIRGLQREIKIDNEG